MLISVAVCPHPPLLVTGLGPERDGDLDLLREACRSAVEGLRASMPDMLVVVGAADQAASEEPERQAREEVAGSFAAYGIDQRVAFPGHEQTPAGDMPLSLSVGAWLLEQGCWAGPVVSVTVDSAAQARRDAAEVGRDIASRTGRLAMLVMADGSASRSSTAPRTFHPRAAEHDAAVSQAIRDGDPRQLLRLDGVLAAEVGSTGVNPLQVMAGAVADAVFDTEVLYEGAPYGVGYLVGRWERHG